MTTVAASPTIRTSVTVRVPATTANLGPGYDTLGMALDIWNEITVTRCNSEELKGSFISLGEGAEQLPTDASNYVNVGLKAAFDSANMPLPLLHVICKNRIPFARGLGSSSAAIVAGIIAGLVLSGHELSVKGSEELLQIAAGIEGHPDNVAPAIYGGLQLGIYTDERWFSSRVALPHGLIAVLFIPDSIGVTHTARALLPDMISRADAIFNIGRVALLVNALATGNFDELRHATQDRLHQPARGKSQYPHLNPLMEAALAAGAHGVFLSGAGPTVLALTSGRAGDIFTQHTGERQEHAVASALRAAATSQGVKGCVFITTPETRGAHVVEASPCFSNYAVARYEGDIKDL